MIELLRHNNGTKIKNSHSRGMKCQPKANINREAVVVCARHVVKRPSKRMRASIYMFICSELIEETGRPPGLIFGIFWA